MAGFKKRTEKDLEKMAGFRKRTTKDLETITELVTAMSERVERLETERAELADRLTEVLARTETIDTRLTSVATELTNQLTELGGEIDRAAEVDPSKIAEVVEASLGEIRAGQVRLANEQARAQMAFRQDVAILIEQLRR